MACSVAELFQAESGRIVVYLVVLSLAYVKHQLVMFCNDITFGLFVSPVGLSLLNVISHIVM